MCHLVEPVCAATLFLFSKNTPNLVVVMKNRQIRVRTKGFVPERWMHLMDIEHKVHPHESGTFKCQRVYVREKVKGKYQYVPVGWRCPDCGIFLQWKRHWTFSNNSKVSCKISTRFWFLERRMINHTRPLVRCHLKWVCERFPVSPGWNCWNGDLCLVFIVYSASHSLWVECTRPDLPLCSILDSLTLCRVLIPK